MRVLDRGLLEDDVSVPELGVSSPIDVGSLRASISASPAEDVGDENAVALQLSPVGDARVSMPVRDARVSMVVQPQLELELAFEPESTLKPATRSGRPQRNRKQINYSEDNTAAVEPHGARPAGSRRLTKKEKKDAEAVAKDLQDARDRAHAAKQQAKVVVDGIAAGTSTRKAEADISLNTSSVSTSSESSLRQLRGLSIRKHFPLRGMVAGVVKDYNGEQDLYTVEYEDDMGCDNLTRAEVESLLERTSMYGDDSYMSSASRSSYGSATSSASIEEPKVWGGYSPYKEKTKKSASITRSLSSSTDRLATTTSSSSNKTAVSDSSYHSVQSNDDDPRFSNVGSFNSAAALSKSSTTEVWLCDVAANAAAQQPKDELEDPTWLRGPLPTITVPKHKHTKPQDDEFDDPAWLRDYQPVANATKKQHQHAEMTDEQKFHVASASTRSNAAQTAAETSDDFNEDTTNSSIVDVITKHDQVGTLTKRLSDFTGATAEDTVRKSNTADEEAENPAARELSELKQKYFEVKGRKPAGRYVNDIKWLKKNIAAAEKQQTAKEELMHSAELVSSEDEEEQIMEVEEPMQRICDFCKLEFETYSGKSLCVNCRELPTTAAEKRFDDEKEDDEDSEEDLVGGVVKMSLDEHKATAKLERDDTEKANRRKSTRRASGRLSTHASIEFADEPCEDPLALVSQTVAVVPLQKCPL